MFIRNINPLPGLSAIFALSIGLASNVQAVTINFDDIEPRAFDFEECTVWGGRCGLDDQYESKGVIFAGTVWLRGNVLPDGSRENKVYSQFGISFTFTENLPNFVSFNVDSSQKYEISFFEVYGENGEHLFTQRSNGWTGFEETSTPYIPGELVSLHSSQGIKSIYVGSLFNLRAGPSLDNLTFEQRSVPEPSLLLMLLTGLIGLHWKRKNYFAHYQDNY